MFLFLNYCTILSSRSPIQSSNIYITAPSSNPPSPQKSPKKSPAAKAKRGRKKNTTKSPPPSSKSPTSKSPPPPLPTQSSKLHPFFASKEQRIALEKEREAAELKQREEQLLEKERQLRELGKSFNIYNLSTFLVPSLILRTEQRNKANPPAPIFLTKEQKIKKKLEQERAALLESVQRSREETVRLSEGKEAHPFLLPRAFERVPSEVLSFPSSPSLPCSFLSC